MRTFRLSFALLIAILVPRVGFAQPCSRNFSEIIPEQPPRELPREFGLSVAIDADAAVVGASGSIEAKGEAHIFERAAGDWSKRSRLRPEDLEELKSGDLFGYSAAIDQERIVIGAPKRFFQNIPGSACICVAIDGDTIAVGSRYADWKQNLSDSGAVYVFQRKRRDYWEQEKKFPLGRPTENDNFGFSLAISGNYLAVGADFYDDRSGAVFIFERNGAWHPSGPPWTVPDTGHFGYSVDIDGNTVVAGASGSWEAFVCQLGQ
jgi:hypothetical protein